MQANWVDVLIALVVLWYAYSGYRWGFTLRFFELLGVVLIIVFSFWTYPLAAHFLTARFQLFRSLANMIAFLGMLLIGQLVYFGIFCSFVCYRLEFAVRASRWSKLDKFLGVIPGLVLGLVLITLFLSVLVALPFSPAMKADIIHSRLGGTLFSSTNFLAPYVEQSLGRPVDDLLALLLSKTREPVTGQLALPDVDNRISVDVGAEQQMLALVNQARREKGLTLLIPDRLLTSVARAHSEEMWKLRYFGHNSPVSGTPLQRLLRAGASFSLAGENIALAPDVSIAFSGLMRSPEHRANILDPDFRKVGIGIVSAGIYGEMFTQDFTD